MTIVEWFAPPGAPAAVASGSNRRLIRRHRDSAALCRCSSHGAGLCGSARHSPARSGLDRPHQSAIQPGADDENCQDPRPNYRHAVSPAGFVAPVTNFVLLGPAITTPPGFLMNAAARSTEVNLAALLSLVTARSGSPLRSRRCPSSAVQPRDGYLVRRVRCGHLFGADLRGDRRSLHAGLEPGVRQGRTMPILPIFRHLRPWRGQCGTRRITLNLFVSGGALLVLYCIVLSLQTDSARVVDLWPGHGRVADRRSRDSAPRPSTVMLMFMPMGLSQLALALWLIARGFADRSAAHQAAE